MITKFERQRSVIPGNMISYTHRCHKYLKQMPQSFSTILSIMSDMRRYNTDPCFRIFKYFIVLGGGVENGFFEKKYSCMFGKPAHQMLGTLINKIPAKMREA